MKKSNLKMILFVFYIVLFTAYVQAETHITTNLNMIIEGDEITEGEVVHTLVDVVAQFPGGTEALQKYLSENIKYPIEAIKNKQTGRVYVQFVIDKEGEVTNVKVLKGVCESLDAEAIRVIYNMPKWDPAKIDNKTVNMQYTIPINFAL